MRDECVTVSGEDFVTCNLWNSREREEINIGLGLTPNSYMIQKSFASIDINQFCTLFIKGFE